MCKSSRDCASYTECNLLLIVCLLSLSCFMCVLSHFMCCLFMSVCLSVCLLLSLFYGFLTWNKRIDWLIDWLIAALAPRHKDRCLTWHRKALKVSNRVKGLKATSASHLATYPGGWKQTCSHKPVGTLDWSRRGDMPKIVYVGRSLWKRLRSSLGRLVMMMNSAAAAAPNTACIS